MADDAHTLFDTVKRWLLNKSWVVVPVLVVIVLGSLFDVAGKALDVWDRLMRPQAPPTVSTPTPSLAAAVAAAPQIAPPLPAGASAADIPPAPAPAGSAPLQASPGATSASAATDGCTVNAPLKLCPESLTYSAIRLRDDLVVKADMSIRIVNVGSAPMALFTARAAAALHPDVGPALTLNANPRGISRCDNLASVCLGNSQLSTSPLPPGGEALLHLSLQERVPAEQALTIARSRHARLSYTIQSTSAEPQVPRPGQEHPFSVVFNQRDVSALTSVR